MDTILYYLARTLLGILQGLPLPWVARLGQAGGTVAYWLDRRHRRVALANLEMCFGKEKTPAEIRALARENFRRIGESYACAVKTAVMTHEELRPRIEIVAPPDLLLSSGGERLRNLVFAIGHFGNFELYARLGGYAPGYKFATTYRGLRQPSLNRLLQSLRERSGCFFFERRWDAQALKAAMNQGQIVLGLLSDQNAGRGGLRLPFLGHECSTSAASALFALRYDGALRTAICYRVGLARWRIEVGPEIPRFENGKARSSHAMTLEVNRAFEAAVRRDPANWFWVHDRWKARKVLSPLSTVHSPQSQVEGAKSAGMV
jgi:lauroyl/myristoyl acyltransferase